VRAAPATGANGGAGKAPKFASLSAIMIEDRAPPQPTIHAPPQPSGGSSKVARSAAAAGSGAPAASAPSPATAPTLADVPTAEAASTQSAASAGTHSRLVTASDTHKV
jgi:hypothetical protein